MRRSPACSVAREREYPSRGNRGGPKVLTGGVRLRSRYHGTRKLYELEQRGQSPCNHARSRQLEIVDFWRGMYTVDLTNRVEKIPPVGQEVLDVRLAFRVRSQSLN